MAEPLAIEFANTHYAQRGDLREGIGTAADLSAWLSHNGRSTAGVDASSVAAFVELRDAIRAVLGAVVAGERAAPEWIGVLNRVTAAAPRWPVLSVRSVRSVQSGRSVQSVQPVPDGGYTLTERTGCAEVTATLADIATDAMRILAGPPRADLRACPGPGCVLFFVKDHPRREWCSAGCGNRARAARHYQRHRPGPALP